MTELLERESAHQVDDRERRDTPDPDEQRTNALVERLFGSFVAGAELLTVELGRRLGLYAALAVGGPATSTELGSATGISERYAREWLEQQAAAGLVDVAQETGVRTTRSFELPAAHVPVLLDADHPANLIAFAPFLTGLGLTLPAVAEAYRSGAGVSFEQFGAELRHGISLGNRPMFVNELAGWIDHLPDVAQRLRAGGSVLDVGCGVGHSSTAIATSFPAVTVEGIDMDSASVVEARTAAAAAGLSDRVRFTLGNASDATDLPGAAGGYQLVTIFEALHDMGDPVGGLRAARGLLAGGGVVLVADERVSDEFQAPAGEVDRLMHAASVLHCLPATMAESQTTANGTVLRASTVRRWAHAAGFTTTELPIENPLWRFYRLDPADC
jgi:2-polyprenyl-3-methyl-5-hydroxy-6-metoxy-1,4-benzoquinol methylase